MVNRVLMVANERPAIDRLVCELCMEDIDVLICEESEAAEVLLAHYPVQTVVTDLCVSAVDGFDGVRLIRHIATHFPEIKIIAAHDWIDDNILNLVKGAGGRLLIHKPIEVQTLKTLLQADHESVGTQESEMSSLFHLKKLDDILRPANIRTSLQPIIDLSTSGSQMRAYGVESLARLGDSYQRLSPEVLFAYAARKERLFETDILCIGATLSEAKKINRLGKLFINVRPRSLINAQFVSCVIRMAQEANFSHDDIVFELTEQQTILNAPAFTSTLQQLRTAGFGIALDDFGVGFANFQLVYDLRPDYIKLSGIFCRDLEKDAYKQVLVSSMTQLGRSLHIPIILENVETEAEMETARRLGVAYAQGYYFCRPVDSTVLNSSALFAA